MGSGAERSALTFLTPCRKWPEMPLYSTSIVFYKSSLCPRCMLVKRELTRLRQEHPELEVEELDVVLNPLQAWRSGIRMIPALKAGDDILTGVLLRTEQVRQFVARHLDRSARTRQETI